MWSFKMNTPIGKKRLKLNIKNQRKKLICRESWELDHHFLPKMYISSSKIKIKIIAAFIAINKPSHFKCIEKK